MKVRQIKKNEQWPVQCSIPRLVCKLLVEAGLFAIDSVEAKPFKDPTKLRKGKAHLVSLNLRRLT